MSLSLATGIAMGGLRSTQEQSVIASRNLSGASVPAYVRKDVSLYTRIVGGSTIGVQRSEEHTSELQSLIRISYAVFCLYKFFFFTFLILFFSSFFFSFSSLYFPP